MENIVDLILTPFRDIVDKGRTAVQNAGDTQPMLKASQALLKEGERALKKIEPLCKKHFDDFGPAFIEAVKDNDMLWEFDDYIEVDDFDADKFTELQMMSRTAAPKIYDILLKMKLEAPAQAPAAPFNQEHFMSQLSPPSSPHPTPTMLLPPMMPNMMPTAPPSTTGASSVGRDSVSSSKTDSRSVMDTGLVENANEQLSVILDKAFNSDNSNLDLIAQPPPMPPPDRALPPPPPPPPVTMEQLPPRPPSTNPWDIRVKTVASDDERPHNAPSARRRPPVDPSLHTPIEGTSPISPYTTSRNFSIPRPNHPDSARSSGLLQEYTSESDEKHSSLGTTISSQLSTYSMSPTQTSRPRAPSNHSATIYNSSTPTIPEEMTRGKNIRSRSTSRQRPSPVMYSPMPYRSQRPRQPSYPASSDERMDDAKTIRRNDSLTESGHQSTERRGSDAESLIDPNPLPVSTRGSVAESRPPPTPNPEPPLPTREQQQQQQPGLELVRRNTGRTIQKKPGLTTAVVAKCTHCLYEIDFKLLELDVGGKPEGNYTKNGVGYRLRFLQKSHLHAKRVDDIMYACVFCIHTSRTLDQSDATVFTSTAALFTHLARHPRPLPDVPGIAVVDQEEVPPHLANDYDLLFVNPPEPHPVQDKAAEIAHLPTAHAKTDARRLFGQRLLPDRTPALELITGAKITGLTWPARYAGEWAFGWHDGVHASVPMEVIKLDRPPFNLIKRNNTSRIRAKAKWRFAPKEKNEDWLKFEKDEIITNITWSYPEYWCWAGTNSKGKWGVFPQAFLDSNSLQEITSTIGSDRASILSNEKNKSSTMLPKFSTRSKNGRPPSVAGSTSSGESRSVFGTSRSLRRSREDY
ncbi:uncharacterized protein TRIVIDRAFT_149603 [Trichoderma virens Gv29-8]|uniref:SH3 domain-containing protein n=1 Tax=Hypocrea virens (strain Gv29-8 / FGSC 10586) TaxID=413071 RepID=G9MSR9_HYPVG|nr:uncharacterized protein TRIVIDRAFT_149603 [Trichoderma virens Gv29-8]EHK22229.1 hypothetical protein TRIVIDRAFT_149603 [Trichoderma virens Gv29-8]UKZ47269.1 hypothetical protein TrVGV298_001486 [Trichoderma virens]